MSREQAANVVVELVDGWQVAQYQHDGEVGLPSIPDTEWIDATVPGMVHYDLIRVARLGNPYASVAAVRAASWVAQSDWVYRTTFRADRSVADGRPVFLEFDGIDTFADIWLNGRLVGATANAFRSYRFSLEQNDWHDGSNELVVHVKSHDRMIEKLIPEAKQTLKTTFGRKGLTRRYQRSYFSNTSQINLGGEVLGIGVFKPARLVIGAALPVESCHLAIRNLTPDLAVATVEVLVPKRSGANQIRVAVTLVEDDTDNVAATATGVLGAQDDRASIELEVANPRLWWPRGYGRPDLYRLRVELFDGESCVGSKEQTVGLKSAEIVRILPSGRPSFHLRVNGTDVHVRGFNIMPIEYLRIHGAPERYDQLLRLVCEAHGNLVRIWGGGVVESERFYDACDRLGIMVWHDFFLHSTTYPDYDEAWVDALRVESEELVRRLRHHASLTVWCGGNEQIEGWDEWGWRARIDKFYGESLITELLPKIVRQNSPSIPYVVNSPHGGSSAHSPLHGDTHCWGNYYNSTKDPLFVTETCWNVQSYSRPATLRVAMDLDVDRFSEIGWPDQWRELTNLPIFPRPSYTGGPLRVASLRDYLSGLEIEHAWADYHALSNLRLRSPSCRGIIYWPLNKGAPLFDFGCVDFAGVPLASFYVIKRLFADVAIGIYRDVDDIRVVGSNLGAGEVAAQLGLVHVALDGSILHAWEPRPVRLAAGQNSRLGGIDAFYSSIVDRSSELVHASLVVNGVTITEDTLFFCPLSDFQTKPNAIRAAVAQIAKDRWTLTLRGSSVAKLVMIEGNQNWLLSDNYFPLVPSHDRQIDISLLQPMTQEPPSITVSVVDSKERHTLRLPCDRWNEGVDRADIEPHAVQAQ
jgi:beta-mannosidase